MPPKAEGATSKAIVPTEAFLAACIKHAKERVIVDFVSLSQELGISSGGAANKYRALMKTFEQEGAAWAKDTDNNATPKTDEKKKAAPSKRKSRAKVKVEEGDAAGAEENAETPAKRAKTQAPKAKANAPTNTPATAKIAPKIKDEPDADEIVIAKVEDVEEKNPSAEGEGGEGREHVKTESNE